MTSDSACGKILYGQREPEGPPRGFFGTFDPGTFDLGTFGGRQLATVAAKQQAYRLFISGLPSSEIAKTLGFSPATVSNWAKDGDWESARQSFQALVTDRFSDLMAIDTASTQATHARSLSTIRLALTDHLLSLPTLEQIKSLPIKDALHHLIDVIKLERDVLGLGKTSKLTNSVIDVDFSALEAETLLLPALSPPSAVVEESP